jgi:hypothetical protein
MTSLMTLSSAQAMLSDRGVKDVKFCFSNAVLDSPLSEAQAKLTDFLGCYLNGHSVTHTAIGDKL